MQKNQMEKIYTAQSKPNANIQAENPKVQTIQFLLNFSKVLRIQSTKTIGKVDYLLN